MWTNRSYVYYLFNDYLLLSTYICRWKISLTDKGKRKIIYVLLKSPILPKTGSRIKMRGVLRGGTNYGHADNGTREVLEFAAVHFNVLTF